MVIKGQQIAFKRKQLSYSLFMYKENKKEIHVAKTQEI